MRFIWVQPLWNVWNETLFTKFIFKAICAFLADTLKNTRTWFVSPRRCCFSGNTESAQIGFRKIPMSNNDSTKLWPRRSNHEVGSVMYESTKFVFFVLYKSTNLIFRFTFLNATCSLKINSCTFFISLIFIPVFPWEGSRGRSSPERKYWIK